MSRSLQLRTTPSYTHPTAQATVPIQTSENRTPYDSMDQHDFAVAVLTVSVVDLKGVGGLFQRLCLSKT